MQSCTEKRNNIRNVTLVSHAHHGKTTIRDLLIRASGIIKYQVTGQRYDTYEREVGYAFKSTASSLFVSLPSELELPKNADGCDFLINLIDTPEHTDYSSEDVASIRVSDDLIQHVRPQTENSLRLALAERVVPALVLNKLDVPFQQLGSNVEDIYQFCCHTIDHINITLHSFKDDLMGDVTVHPEKGTVCFCSALQEWGFTLDQFARLYASKFGVNPNKMAQRLWGDNYFDPEAKKWISQNKSVSGKPLSRAFCKFVLEPIAEVYAAVMSDNKEKLDKIFQSLKLKLTSDQKECTGILLFKNIMRTWLPAAKAMEEVIIQKLPSPVVAQQYRVDNLYTGPQDDITAAAIRSCDPKGPLVMFVSRMVHQGGYRFAAFGRVFSGTLSRGAQVRIMGSNCQHGKKDDLYIKTVAAALTIMGCKAEKVDSITAGNLCAVLNIDQYILKTATLATDEHTHPIVNMKYSTSPVMRIAVEPKNPSDLPKLVEALKRLSKSDPLISVFVEESGEHIIAGCSECHLESCLKDLSEFMGGIELIRSQPAVEFRETVVDTSPVCLSKSPNRHNRIYCVCTPLGENVCQAMETAEITERQDPKARARILSEKYEWDMSNAMKIWSFEPHPNPTNLLVDMTKGVQYVNEIKDSCIAAFAWATKVGVLAEENMRGIRFNIVDFTMIVDAVHRGGGQIIPMARRAMYACQLSANPRLMEPVYLAEISCPPTSIANVYSVINNHGGQIIEEHIQRGSPFAIVRCYLPVMQSIGLSSDLDSSTYGHAIPQYTFDHWKMIPDDPLDITTRAGELVTSIRKRKGLAVNIPDIDRFLDKL